MAEDETKLLTAQLRLNGNTESVPTTIKILPTLGLGDTKGVKIQCIKGKRTVLAELYIDHDEALQLVSSICKALDWRDTEFRELLADSELLGKASVKDRKSLGKILKSAIDMCRDRTATEGGDFNRGLTNAAEYCDFLKHHRRLIDAVNHVHENDAGKLTPGYAAALHYLMACSGTSAQSVETYRKLAHRDEDRLDFSLWDQAKEFWIEFQLEKGALQALREAKHPRLGDLPDRKNWTGLIFGQDGATKQDKFAAICKAWAVFKDKGAVTASDVALDYAFSQEADEKGNAVVADDWHLNESTSLGGIDLGD